MQDRRTWEAMLLHEYGALLNTTQIAHVLGYRSASALEKARQRGRLPVQTVKIPGRRGWYASSSQIADWLANTFPDIPRRSPP